jgi:hypothetical protein
MPSSWRSRRRSVSTSKHTQHVEEGLAGSGVDVNRLFGRPQRDASALELVDNVPQVLQRPREMVDASDNQGVTWLNVVEAPAIRCASRRFRLFFSARITLHRAAGSGRSARRP